MRAAAQANDRAIGQRHFHAEHIVARHAVFQTARSARIRGDVAANAAFGAAGRVRRIIKPELFDRVLELLRDHARLHDRHKIERIDLPDAVHSRQRKDDAAARRDTSAHISEARSARRHRQVVPMSETQDGRD